MAYTINGKTACRYCGREGKVSAIVPGIAWQLKKSDDLADLIDGQATQV
jgi:hypothetical protein